MNLPFSVGSLLGNISQVHATDKEYESYFDSFENVRARRIIQQKSVVYYAQAAPTFQCVVK